MREAAGYGIIHRVIVANIVLAAASAATGCAEFAVQSPRGGCAPVVRAADFGFSATNDFNAAAVNRALEHCRKTRAHTLELDEGVYNCFDAPSGIAITNMTDFTFDGRGAVLVFRRPPEFRGQAQSELVHENANLLVKDCERVKVCDFKMDWDWERDPLACFCRCVDVHVDETRDGASYADFAFTDFERHPKYPADVPVQAMRPMDESRTAFAPGPVWHFGLSEGHWGAKSEWLAPNRLRVRPGVKARGKPYNPASDFLFTAEKNRELTRLFRKGRLYRLQHYYYGKNGINMVGNRHLTMQEIDIWSCFGMGMVVDGKQEYWQVENVRIEPRPDAPYRRPVSSVSDAYHVARSRGHAKHLNMRIRLNNDDAMNFHDRFAIAKRTGPRSLEIAMNRGIGYFRPSVGDPLELRSPDWRPTGFDARLARVDGETMILDRDIPESLQGAFFVFDRAYGTDNVILRGCTFEDTPHRNLFSSSNLTIEDCVFRRVGSFPVRIIADARTRTWCEGLGETNIVVRNNLFLDACRLRRPDPVFSTALVRQIPWETGPDDPNFMRDILIEKNVLVDPAGPAALFEAGSNIVVRNNEIRFTRQPLSAESGTFVNAGAANVVVEENRTVANAPPVDEESLLKDLRASSAAPRYGGIYDKEDPPPADRAKALREMAAIRPSTVSIARRRGRNVLLLDGKPTPLNQYKGFADYRQMGECGGNMVITFNRGQRLFRDATFDKADLDPATGTFDFSRIEDTLLRIHAANPGARVFVNVDLDPDVAFLERNPDSIFLNEKGVRGRSNFQAFGGFDSSPLDPKDKRAGWAFSYTSEAWRKYAEDALAKLCAYLKSTPAGNIVVGFHLSGGMDGQFVQWQYGPENGHFDYSESNRRALCRYLGELYGSDAALQKAWGDPHVTLATARNPSVAEFRSMPVFDDRPGPGRRLADCRRFVAVGPARALNGFARRLKREMGRPCLVETWYTSTIWSQPGRLAIDELVKDGGVDVICTVSGYSRLRALDGIGASANNSIAGLNLRGLLYVQEMDHRTWRTQHTGGFMAPESVAMPRDEREFANQVRRDACSVIAAGGAGFHLFDMFGSWYHGSRVRPAIREIYALNAFATAHAGGYPAPRAAIFTDEKARLLRDSTADMVNAAWRTSGIMPAIHYLSDLDNPALPEYDLYVAYSPVTVSASQAGALRRRAGAKGKVLAVVGPVALASRDFAGEAEALGAMKPAAGTFVRVAREAGLTPEALNAWAKTAGMTPFAEPGNATYVGNGVACVHRLREPAAVDFGREVVLVDPLTGKKSQPVRAWRPALARGESAATCYMPAPAAAAPCAAAAPSDARFRDGCSQLDANPARGAAPGGWHRLGKSGNAAGSPSGFCSWLWEIGEFSGGNEYKGNPPPGCVGGRDLPLTQDALAAVSNTLVNARANGAVMIVRFAYTSGSETGAEPTDFETIVGHVGQIGAVLGAFPDVVLAVECGMIGPWGEMHSNGYREPHHVRALTEAWLGSLHRQTALLVRYPKWILDCADRDADVFMRDVAAGTYYRTQPAQRRLGMFNDGYLGTEADYGTWRTGKRWMTREQGVEYLEARRNVPYGGELAHISEEEAEAVGLLDVSKYNVVREFYRTHLSYLRNIDSRGHNLADRIGRLTLTHAYDFEGMPDLDEWYGRDLRSFVRAHMGYRFVLRGARKVRGAVEVTVENTGFGHLLLKSRAELSSGALKAEVPMDLRALRPGRRHAFSLPLPRGADGEIRLRLFADTPARQPVLFANDALFDRGSGAFRIPLR